MKLIFHLISLGFCLAGIHSALISDLHKSLLAYFKTHDYPNEYDPLDQKHYLNEDPHTKDRKHNLNEDPHSNDKKHNLDEDSSSQEKVVRDFTKNTGTQRYKVKDAETDNDHASQISKSGEWGKKYPFHNDEVNPKQALEEEGGRHNDIKELNTDVAKAKIKTQLLRKLKKKHLAKQIPILSSLAKSDLKSAPILFIKDPVLNSWRKQSNFSKILNYRRNDDSDKTKTSSSSLEINKSKGEFYELWAHKKLDALNKTHLQRGDKVNMFALRPWSVACGDPNQHGMPWGMCIMAAECDAEYRIPRGDLFCGRTQLICCGSQLFTYDTNQAFGISFEDKSTDEKRGRMIISKKRKKRKNQRERRKQQTSQVRRKKHIKKQIKKVMREIQKIMNQQFNNSTAQRKNRTKQLKEFINYLKKQYKKNRQSVQNLHDSDVAPLDKGLMERLQHIKMGNSKLSENATFRDIVLKETFPKKSVRILLQAYPELEEFLESWREGGRYSPVRGGGTRHAGDGHASRENESEDKVLEYDVEYGYLYY